MCPSFLGETPLVETSNQEVQVDLMNICKAQSELKAELEDRNRHIDVLEKKLETFKSKGCDSDKIQKLLFDNQILLGRLG